MVSGRPGAQGSWNPRAGAKAVGLHLGFAEPRDLGFRSRNQEVTLTCRPAKARGITRRRAPEDLRPFLRAAGKRLEAGTGRWAGSRAGWAGLGRHPWRTPPGGRDPRDAQAARARL